MASAGPRHVVTASHAASAKAAGMSSIGVPESEDSKSESEQPTPESAPRPRKAPNNLNARAIAALSPGANRMPGKKIADPAGFLQCGPRRRAERVAAASRCGRDL